MPKEQEIWKSKNGKYIYYIINEINGRFYTIMKEKDNKLDEFLLRSSYFFENECEYLGKANINYNDLFCYEKRRNNVSKIECKESLKELSESNLDNLNDLKEISEYLQELIYRVKNKYYVCVEVVNGDGDISNTLKDVLTSNNIKAECEWSGNPGYRGCNYIYIHTNIWDEKSDEILYMIKEYDIDNKPEIKDYRKSYK